MKHRRYELNEHAFDEMQTSEKWYWLGFLLADGSVFTRRQGREWLLQVKLQRADLHLVESLRHFLRYTGKIRYLRKDNAVVLVIYSKRLCMRLIELGVVPRKSFDGHPIPVVPNHFAFAFFRGHFDANGCIHQRTENSFRLEFSGQRRLMRWLQEKIEHLVGAVGGRIDEHTGCASLVYGRRPEVNAIAQWLCGFDDFGSNLPCLLRKRVSLDPLLQGE